VKTLKQIILEIAQIERELTGALRNERIKELNRGRQTSDTAPIDFDRVKNFAQQIHSLHQRYSKESIANWTTLAPEEQETYIDHALSALGHTHRGIIQDREQNHIDSSDTHIMSQENFDAAHQGYKTEMQSKPLAGVTEEDGIDLFHRIIIMDAHNIIKGRKSRKSSKANPLESLGEQN